MKENPKKIIIPYVNPFAKPEIQDKIKQDNLVKFGVEYSAQRPEVIKKIKEKRFNSTIKKYQTILNDTGIKLKFIKHNGNTSEFYCDTCGNNFIINFNTFKTRLIRDHKNPCPYCLPINKRDSAKERQFHEFIKKNYNGIVMENTYSILNGKEIDIYLPDLKLGFEFDGTYWHADPRFYKPDDIIEHKKVTAKEIWERMRLKDEMCLQKNIKLVHIKEYDWDNDENIRIKIINILKQY